MLKNNSTHTSLGSKYQYVIQFEKKKFNRILINELRGVKDWRYWRTDKPTGRGVGGLIKS